MTTQFELFAPERLRFWLVSCRNPKTGSEWAHRVADPEETVRMVRAMGFEGEVRER